jgi:hypothetical protein
MVGQEFRPVSNRQALSARQADDRRMVEDCFTRRSPAPTSGCCSELAIRQPGQPLFNVAAPGFRLQQVLGNQNLYSVSCSQSSLSCQELLLFRSLQEFCSWHSASVQNVRSSSTSILRCLLLLFSGGWATVSGKASVRKGNRERRIDNSVEPALAWWLRSVRGRSV